MAYLEHLSIETAGHRHMTDLTDEVGRVVKRSRVTSGLVNVFNVGSTGAVGTIEFEPGLGKDRVHKTCGQRDGPRVGQQCPGVFQRGAVLNARRADGFACAAAETSINVVRQGLLGWRKTAFQ